MQRRAVDERLWCLQEQDLATEECPDLAEGVVAASVFIHQSVERTSAAFLAELRRAAYVTPTSYLELLNTVTSLLGERREALERTRSRLAVGLEKLLTTAGTPVASVEACRRPLQLCSFATEPHAVAIYNSKRAQDAGQERGQLHIMLWCIC